MMDDFEPEVKPDQKCIRIILLGNSQAGKTSLLVRYTDNTFSNTFSSTIGVDFRIKRILVKGKEVRLEVWDTSGQERYRTVTKSYFERAMGVVLVYDCADERSFSDIRNWIKQLENHAKEDIVKVLVGNKCDLAERVIDKDTGKALAKEFGMPFLETSAKNNVNVEEAFTLAAEHVINQDVAVKPEKNGPKKLETPRKDKIVKDSCC
eukprot:TRINITY_DN11169_c0_g1_i2.p1 TRINITY_DN11169_c0_g1~~TRINITY_DN11169_c0_g1_i2.p1  ORF type:complete len:207 (-),score=70.93 TRINITY_DN11169_c0_g1_i2:147-767(-)